MASPVFELVVTPAVVSGIVTFLLGQRNDGLKAQRDYRTKIADAARDDVRKATELSVSYFATSPDKRSIVQEAMIIVAERDVRNSVKRLIDGAADDPELQSPKKAVRKALIGLMALLTGGSFQQRNATKINEQDDAELIRRLASEAAVLRGALADLRDRELRLLTWGASIERKLKPVKDYLLEQRGPL
jgi:hypothetical protein